MTDERTRGASCLDNWHPLLSVILSKLLPSSVSSRTLKCLLANGWNAMRRLSGMALLVSFLSSSVQTDALQPDVPDDRVKIAILPPQNLTGDSNAEHWQHSIPVLLKIRLREVRSIRVLPDSSIEFAFCELKYEPSRPLEPYQVRKLGALCAAQWVIWGNYQTEREQWNLTVKVMNVGTGKTSRNLTVTSSDLSQLVYEVGKKILQEVSLNPTSSEDERMKHLLTNSAEALELSSRAYADLAEGKPLSDAVDKLRRAVSLDPEFAMAKQDLAHYLLLQGKTDESLAMTKDLIKRCPDYAAARSTLGLIYYSEGSNQLAQVEFTEAARLDPDESDNYFRIGQIYALQHEWDKAVSFWKKAELLAPYDAVVHTYLARGYFHLGLRDRVLTELTVAERYDIGTDPGVAGSLGSAYELLHETAKAVKYYRKFIAMTGKMGIQAPEIKMAEEKLAFLEPRLTPHFVKAAVPQTFTSAALQGVLKLKLTPEEYELSANPLACTAKMRKWAEQSVGDTRDDMDKARRLFYGLTRHVNISDELGGRTAAEAFEDLFNPKASLRCQDYTFLYVALARSVGLKAYFVLVNQDYRGKFVLHSCAGVLMNGKALLIDPSYDWFGAPHQQYEFVDDLRATAIHMCGVLNMPTLRAGLKLVPDWALPHFHVARILANGGYQKEAREILQAGLKLDSKSWLASYVRGLLAGYENNWGEAAMHMQGCLSLNPDYSPARFLLATALAQAGKLKEAKDEYQTYLHGETDPESEAKARAAIAYIDANVTDKQEDATR
jgi:tetratricopeptide (TPR) repeat protein/TolB-like protein